MFAYVVSPCFLFFGRRKFQNKMSVTTRKGDEGKTELLFGVKVSKTDPQVVALGDLDELNAAFGLVRVLLAETEKIDRMQSLLVTLMGEVAMPIGEEKKYAASGFSRIGVDEVALLEGWIAELEAGSKNRGWLRPGADGRNLAAHWQVARTVARRAERALWALPESLLSRQGRIFLNRVSDWCWLCAKNTSS